MLFSFQKNSLAQVITPTTPFVLTNQACNQQNLRVVAIEFRADDPSDLVGTLPGTPITGEIWATWAVSGQGYNPHIQFNISIDGGNSTAIANCVSVKGQDNVARNIIDGETFKIAEFTWPYGSELTIDELYIHWLTGNINEDTNACQTSAGNAQCSRPQETFLVRTPLAVDFDFNTNCNDFTVDFEDLTTGGNAPDGNYPGDYIYSWTFENGNPLTSSVANPLNINFGSAGEYDVTLSVTSEGITKSITKTVVLYPQLGLSFVKNDDDCAVSNTGSIDLSVTGGIGPFTYSWTKTGDAGYSFSGEDPAGLAAGTYNVTVTDNRGCVATTSVIINQGICSLTITKSLTNAEDAVVDTAGEIIEYTITVDNTGNEDLTNVVVDDVFAGGATYVSGDANDNDILETTETWVYSADYVVTQADLNAGLDLVNVAGVTTDQTARQTDDATSTIDQNPSIDLIKTASLEITGEEDCSRVIAGETVITYTFTVTNLGNVSLAGIAVIDEFPNLSAIELISGDLNNDQELDVTETWIYTATYTVTQNDVDAGVISNSAIVTTNDSSVTDSDTFDISICQQSDLSILKTVVSNDNTLNGDLTFDITVTNTGNTTLFNIYVEDVQTGDNWTVAELAPNQSDSRSITVNISQALIDGGCYENTAIAEVRQYLDSQDAPDQNSGEYQVVLRAEPSSVTTCFTQSPAIELLKDGVFNDENNDGFGNVGETITYSFSVENTGNVTLSNVTITDEKVTVIGGPLASLAPGAVDNTTFTATYVLTQADLDNGFVINTALAEGTAPNGEVVEDESSDPTPVEEPSTECTTCTETEIPQNPDVEIVKTDNGAVVDAAGDVITYTLTVTNNGNLTLTNVIITDPLTKYTENVGTLAPGQTAIRTTSYTVTQADVDAGLVLNTAEVTTESPDGENPQDETEEETQIQRTATLIIEKSDNNAAVSVAGDVITYTLTATNTGNVTLTNVIITDPLTKLDENVGTLAPGQSVTRSTSYTVTQADVDAGFVLNTAFVDSESPEGENPSDDDEVETPINRVSDILITKVADLDGVTDAGEVITYTITVTNTGNTSLTNVAVKDPKTGLSEVIPTLVPGQSVSFETTYTVTIDDIAAQETILNVATATYTDPVTDEEKSEEAEELVDVICIDRTLITGTIFNDMTGEPLAGVPVTLVPQGNTPGAIQIVVTGADGRYTFKDFPAGSYLVQVQDANLNAARGLFPVESSLFFTDIQVCIYQTQNFGYETYDGVVLGDFVWYDINGDGIQNEWYDANNDGQVTQNPIQGEAIDLSMWEWFDLNGDGRYDGPENEGELNKGGFGNAQSANITVTGPNGYEDDVIVGIIGYWRTRPDNSDLGDYTATLNIDEFLAAEAERMRGTGLIKVLPDADARMTDINASRTEVRCGATTGNEITRTVTATEQVFLDMDFGIRCLDAEVQIIANDDQFGDHLISFGGVIGNILDNDLLEGQRPDPADVDFEFTELDGIIGLLIDENGELSLIPGVNEVRDYTLGYTLRETVFPDNSDDALVFFRILSDSVDLSVTKTSFGVEIYEGDEFEYEIVVSNIGDTPATNVTIVDNLPASVTYISSRVESVSSQQIQVGAPTVNGSTITWNVPFLPASGVITLRVRVRAGDPGSIQNVVVVDSEEDETDASNNTDTDVNQVLPFHIPNVITPNNDGDNDTFEIRGLGKFAANEIVIFNRYGDHVLEKENYQNDWNAPGQVAGTYFYVLKVTDRSGRAHDFKGWIQVIKE